MVSSFRQELSIMQGFIIKGFRMRRIIMMTLASIFAFVGQNVFAEEDLSPPERANQVASSQGFSTWDLQVLYGSTFHEPGINQDVKKGTTTLENSSGWTYGSSYFFIDYLRSNKADNNATEFYSEWYPSFSVGKVTNRDYQFFLLKDFLITTGINAGSKTDGASPLVFLPGVTFDLKLPVFRFFSLGTYAYIDRGRFNGANNGCNNTTYQITPSWSLPLNVGSARFLFDGFIDFIGSHGQCAKQVLAQPTVKLDLGNFIGKPDRLFAGVEWGLWRNKFGIEGLNQTAPQGVMMLVFRK